MERQTDPATGKIYRLPDYNTVLFSDCHALAARAPGPLVSGQTCNLVGARFISMYDVREQPHRTAKISIARRRPGGNGVATFYR